MNCKRSYLQAGSQLLIFQGLPTEVLPAIATGLGAKAVMWNKDVEPYSRERDRTVAAALREAGIEVETFWDQLLHAPQGNDEWGRAALYGLHTFLAQLER